MIKLVEGHIRQHIAIAEAVAREMLPGIVEFVACLKEAMLTGNKLLVMGNGGSAADAQHFVAEFVGRFLLERKALPAISLTTDTSILTAVGNDYGFDAIFSRQVEALAVAGDVVVGISTSGNSPNVLSALKVARSKGCQTVGLLGRDGGKIARHVDLNLTVPSNDTPRIQEAHALIIHIVCDLVEKELFAQGKGHE